MGVTHVRSPDEANPPAAARRWCTQWWWHAPRSRCLGIREREHVSIQRTRALFGIAVATALVALLVAHHKYVTGVVADSLSSARAGWLVLALVLQAGSMANFARLQRQVLADAGLRLPISAALAISYAGNAVAVTIPLAGSTASAAFTYRQYTQRGASGTMAGWAMVVAGIFSTTTFALLIGAGAIAQGNPIAAIAGIVSITAVAVPIVGVAVALRSPRMRALLERRAVGVLSLFRRLTGRPRTEPLEMVANGVAQLLTYRIRLRHGLAATAFASLNWILDALCLWSVLRAFDVSMPLRNLSLVYLATIAAASLGITPAGIGTVESAIAIALTRLGTDGAHALLAAIVYRCISTWLVLLIGWCILVVLRKRSAGATAASSAVAPAMPLEVAA